MIQNVGTLDRNVRFGLGGLLVVVALAGFAGVLPGLAGATALYGSIAALVVGLVLVVTGYTRTCLLYRVFGIDTRGEAAEADVDMPAESTAESMDMDESDVGGKPKAQ